MFERAMQPRAEARKRERVSLEILALFPLDGHHRLFYRLAKTSLPDERKRI